LTQKRESREKKAEEKKLFLIHPYQEWGVRRECRSDSALEFSSPENLKTKALQTPYFLSLSREAIGFIVC
jgi:hypothetical protein